MTLKQDIKDLRKLSKALDNLKQTQPSTKLQNLKHALQLIITL